MNDGQFFLNIASKEINRANHMDAFSALMKKIIALDSPYLDPSEINLIKFDELVTQKAISLRQGHVGITRTTSHNMYYRGTPLDQLYVYSERHLQLGVMN